LNCGLFKAATRCISGLFRIPARIHAVKKKSIAIPFLCMGIGVGWLLTAWGVTPGVNWVWIVSLGLLGVLLPALGGLDKMTIVVGPFLFVSSMFSLLRQAGIFETNIEVPLLAMAGGVCLLLPYTVSVPTLEWYQEQVDANY